MLRRALLLAALLAPAFVWAQTAVLNVSLPGPYGKADCVAAGDTNDPTITLSWTVVPPSSPIPSTDWVYKVKALPSGANCTTDTDSTNVINQSTISWTTGNTGTYPGSSGDAALKLSKIVSLSKYDCAATTDQVITLCVQLLNGSTIDTSVSKTLTIQLAAPSTPTITSVSGGDGALNVAWSDGTSSTVTVDHYQVTASTILAACPDPTAKPLDATCVGDVVSTGTTSSRSLRLGGLTNKTPYAVEVAAVSSGGNQSAASPAWPGTPVPVNDFWEQYKFQGGQEQGGCGGGAGGLVSLLTMAGLALGLRRRS